MQKILNQFFRLVDEITKNKTPVQKEHLHKEYINLFFDQNNSTLNRIRKEEQDWITENKLIGSFNEIFSIDLKDINLKDYVNYDDNYRVNSKHKDNDLVFQFSINNDIKIQEGFFDDVIVQDNGNIEIKYKTIYKKDSQEIQIRKEEFNRILENAIETKNFQKFFMNSPLIDKDITYNKTKVIIKFIYEPNLTIKPEYENFIKVQKDKVILKKQNPKKNHLLENEKYFLTKLQDKSDISAFHKYRVFKEIFIYFKNSIATKKEKITYTPDDLAKFTSKLLYRILEKLDFFNNKKIVFADYLCGSGNLAMSFIKTLENENFSKDIEHIYLNDRNSNSKIGDILNEYLKKVWKQVPLHPITEINISETEFPLLEEKDCGGGYKDKILPNIIMSNPDFNNEVEELTKIFIEKSHNQAILLLYYGKVLKDIPNYTKLIIKLDCSELFLNTSSKVYLNIFIPNSLENNKIKSHFINIPDIKTYFLNTNDSVWKDKKKEVKDNLLDVILKLIFEKEIKNFLLDVKSTYVILNDKVLLTTKENEKNLIISGDKVFIDREKEIFFEFKEYIPDFVEIIEKENKIYYISNNEDNCYSLPILNGNVDNILIKKYEELKGLL